MASPVYLLCVDRFHYYGLWKMNILILEEEKFQLSVFVGQCTCITESILTMPEFIQHQESISGIVQN